MTEHLNSDSDALLPVVDLYAGPKGERRKWSGSDNAEAYEKYLISIESAQIPPEYRLDDDWEYFYNQLGYRGEEYDPHAKFRIAVCGCSHTFGVGVKWEQTFGYSFKRQFAAHNGLALEEVNLLNFAQGGSSNDYICRTLFAQIYTAQPDVVLVNFTYQNRKEFVDDKMIDAIGVWQTEWDEPHEPSLNYYGYYTDEMGFINTMRNMLLMQYFLKARQIPYIFAWVEIQNLTDARFMKHPVCKSYADQLDRSRFADFKLGHKDRARDTWHPGPQSQEIFGQRLFDFYLQVYSGESSKKYERD